MGLGSFREVLPGLLKSLSVTTGNFALLSLVERELAAVSPSARIVGFKDNRIYVEVESSVHLHELTFRRHEILKVLRDACPAEGPAPAPELKFFLRGTARLTRQERMKHLVARGFLGRENEKGTKKETIGRKAAAIRRTGRAAR